MVRNFQRMQTWPLWHVAPENNGTRPSAAEIFARKHCHRCCRVTFIFAKRKKVTRRRLRRATAPALAVRGPTKSDARVFAPTFRYLGRFFSCLVPVRYFNSIRKGSSPPVRQNSHPRAFNCVLTHFFDPRRRSQASATSRQPTVHHARMSGQGGGGQSSCGTAGYAGAEFPRKGLFCNRQKSSVDFNN